MKWNTLQSVLLAIVLFLAIWLADRLAEKKEGVDVFGRPHTLGGGQFFGEFPKLWI